MSEPKTITIDDVQYVRADSLQKPAAEVDGLKYCVVRTYSAGVHIGYVKDFAKENPQQATLVKSRRLWSWSNAASLSQVSQDGVDNSSKIAIEIPEIVLTDVIEIIPCSEKAANFFKGAPEWKK